MQNLIKSTIQQNLSLNIDNLYNSMASKSKKPAHECISSSQYFMRINGDKTLYEFDSMEDYKQYLCSYIQANNLKTLTLSNNQIRELAILHDHLMHEHDCILYGTQSKGKLATVKLLASYLQVKIQVIHSFSLDIFFNLIYDNLFSN